MKSKQKQRRSTVGYAIWVLCLAGVAFATALFIDPESTPTDRLKGIGSMLAAVWFAYLAGRWREL